MLACHPLLPFLMLPNCVVTPSGPFTLTLVPLLLQVLLLESYVTSRVACPLSPCLPPSPAPHTPFTLTLVPLLLQVLLLESYVSLAASHAACSPAHHDPLTLTCLKATNHRASCPVPVEMLQVLLLESYVSLAATLVLLMVTCGMARSGVNLCEQCGKV